MVRTIIKYLRECALAFLVVSLFVRPVAAGADPNSAPAQQSIAKTARQKLETRITYSCVDQPIDTVLMNLAEQAGIDIVKSPKVTGNVTVKVTGVPLEEALTNILAAHDFTYVATENMVRVIPIPEVALLREPLVNGIYEITYADANELAGALRLFISDRGEIALSKGTSHIIVTDTEAKMKAIDEFIRRIDRMTRQVLVEVRIYDVTSNEGFELSPDWHAGRNAPYTGDLMTFPDEVQTNVTEPYTVYERGEQTEDRTVAGSYPPGFRDAYMEEQIEDTWIYYPERKETDSTYIAPPTIMTNRRRKPFVGGSFNRVEGGTLSFSLLNDAVDLEFALQILHQQVEAKLLANPRVLVVDNETANFEITREIPYTELSQTGRDPITWTRFKKVGIDLQVTPHITRDDMLRLHIIPEFGVVVDLNAEGAPTVDLRRADTIAMVKDGQTIAIGGLRKRETTKDISKVPVLADMPLLGGLFMSETESVQVNELIVFITTNILTEPVLSQAEKEKFGQTEFPGPRPTRLRLENNSRPKAGPEQEEESIADALDLLLKELEPSRR